MMLSNVANREPIQIVEILQPFCQNQFGVAPCAATGTADTKCYNTRATCQDTANFALGTPLSLYFSTGRVAAMGVSGADYIIPSLVSVSTAPASVNLGGSDIDAQGLGNRATVNLVFSDHQHTDRIVDPYVEGRSWNPLNPDRGSFWSRWLVRNLYRRNIEVRVYEGYAGQSLSDMTSRTYFIDRASNVDSSGRVTITGKDILARAEEREAQAPVASPGKLFQPIIAEQIEFEVANAVVDDYAATGTVRVNDELMTYSAVAASANGVTFTISARGVQGTIAEEHDFDAAVQQCLIYDNQAINDVFADLLTTYAGIEASWLDTANWASEVSNFLSLYKLSTTISEPTSVYQLLSEVQEQTLCFLWWDERDALVKMKTLRGYETPPGTLTDDFNILAGSMQITDKPRSRVSQVWTYYNPKSSISKADEPESYLNQFVLADLESETDELYGSQSIRVLTSRWLTSEPLIRYTSNRILNNYAVTPQEISISMDAKDRTYWVGDDFFLSHYLDVDQYGARRLRKWTIISARETVPGEQVQYVAQDTSVFGQIRFIMADGSPDFPGYDDAPAKNCYIGDASGLLSDGSEAGTIS